ncbi:hypothetical protein [Plebeiibacterium sediminum]|uniref:Helix-turn-helix domain-containing protein n=1 Tax=Plebeiibacterium sediminum TaxID=2992112 RepID=A0AAE3M8J2_9BACT|nr:hypothetical protein [Plebeiobacterium sediminum]MCW3788907.1 hypothetical protein [Plebeiobacterium sediminum]
MERQKTELVLIPINELELVLMDALEKYDIKKTQQEKKTDKLYSKTKAYQELGVCYNTLNSLIKKGFIKTNLDGTKIPHSSIEAYKSAQK